VTWRRTIRASFSNKTRFLDARGDERRNNFDIRYAGARGGFDWDLEAMGTVRRRRDRVSAPGLREPQRYTIANQRGATSRAADRCGRRAITRPETTRSARSIPLFPTATTSRSRATRGYVNLIHLSLH